MEIKFTVAELEKKVAELALANPDTTYKRVDTNQCFYTMGQCSNGSHGCIVGQAMVSLQPELKDVLDAHKVIKADINKILAFNAMGYSVYLGNVQSKQDGGMTWGDAHKFSKQFLKTEE